MPKTDAYLRKRSETGVCETCGVEMEFHPRCDACGILCNVGHFNTLNVHRGHSICYSCLKAWTRRDELNGENIAWEYFLKGEEWLSTIV